MSGALKPLPASLQALHDVFTELVGRPAEEFDKRMWAEMLAANEVPRAINAAAGLYANFGMQRRDDATDDKLNYTTDHANHLHPDYPPQLIRLDNTKLPRMQSKVLFVRRIYQRLYEDEMFLNELKERPRDHFEGVNRRFVLLGAAGIGKSALGPYLFWRAVRDGHAVVYQYNCWDTAKQACVVYADGVLQVGYADEVARLMDALYWRSDLLRIFDGVPSRGVPEYGYSIYIEPTNCGPAIYNGIRKHATVLHIPVFSWAEVVALHVARGGTSDLAEVYANYLRLGGVPHSLMVQPRDLEEAIMAVDFMSTDNLAHLAEESGLYMIDHISSRIVHYAISPDLKHAFPVLATDYLADRLMARLLTNKSESEQAFNRLLKSAPREVSEFGVFFQRAAQRILQAGGTFEALEWRFDLLETLGALPDEEVSSTPTWTSFPATVVIPKSNNTKTFCLPSEVVVTEGSRWHATMRNSSRIDSIETDGSLCMMSVRKTQDIVINTCSEDAEEAFKGIVAMMYHMYGHNPTAWPAEIRVYLIVPVHLLNTVTPGSIKRVHDDAFSDVVLTRLKVFSVGLPFSPRYDRSAALDLSETPFETLMQLLETSIGFSSESKDTGASVGAKRSPGSVEHFGGLKL